MKKEDKKAVVFDLWEILIFGTEDSAIATFYKDITGEDISTEQLRMGMLIKEGNPRLFLEKFLQLVTPSNLSAMLLNLKNPKSPLYHKIGGQFSKLISKSFENIRWTPGAIELLELLRDKYLIVIAANVWAYQREFFAKTLGLDKYAGRYLFSCDLGMNKNQILQNLEEILGIGLNSMVYVGKSYEYDILPAVNANMIALQIVGENNVIFPEKVKALIEEELDGKITHSAANRQRKKYKKSNFLIVIPPFYKLLGSHNNRLNLYAAYLSAYLSSLGYENKLYHADSRSHERYITRYQMVFNSIEFYESMKNELAYEEFESYYRDNSFDTVFVTCGDLLNPSFDSGNWDSAKKIAKIVRQVNSRAFITAIGPEIGRQSEDFDLIASGEIETLLPLIIEKKIRGRAEAALLPENKLKGLPLFDIKNMVTEVSPLSMDTIIWRRGCIGACDFCRVAQLNKGLMRYRPMDSIFNDIRLRYKEFGIRNFYIVDANFTSHKEIVIEFCRKLKKEFPDISWRTESRFDTLDRELLVEMKKAGCTHLKLGLENALSEKHQVKTKRVNLQYAAEWIRAIHDAGIKCIVYLMLGGKWFTHEQYRQMYENAKILNADGYTVSLCNPYPGTPAGISYEEWDKRKFIGSHLDIRLIDFWKVPIDIFDAFFSLELKNGREDKDIRKFIE